MGLLRYLIGPSGVGKTTLAEAVRAKYNFVSLINVDDLIRKKDATLFFHHGNRWTDFWHVTQEIFECLENKHLETEGICFADVGAGSLETERALFYFKSKENVVLIYDTAENVYERVRKRPKGHWHDKTLEEFRDKEYSDLRMKIYNTANYCFNVEGLPKPEVCNKFIEFVDTLGQRGPKVRDKPRT